MIIFYTSELWLQQVEFWLQKMEFWLQKVELWLRNPYNSQMYDKN